MDLALNTNHDIFVSDSDLTLTTPSNFVTQSLKIRLQFITNEWFLDVTAGLPYPTVIFEKGVNIDLIYNLYRDEILQTNGVKDLQSLVLIPSNDTRSLNISFVVLEDNDVVTSETILIKV
jgi:hypothetical protein